ncbi:MAG: peptide-methionine (S)-S-oxide reductase MsrA [Candidatus Roizmanbacteria bacterium]|nr:peptide-methionine (S)-S-oxide reductase MsrA [Candidatus Roizmanbacteria bacterium]
MSSNHSEVAVFGGGCFWCTEAVFQRLKGVIAVIPGYSGGALKNPTYEEVEMGETNHVQVTKVEFNPEEILYADLLHVFWSTHDPTTKDRQGADVGTQYRSVIFYTSPEQQKTAEEIKRKLEHTAVFKQPIVTTIEPLIIFYQAEDYHRNYYATHRSQPYCQLVIDPKIEKLRATYREKLKSI